jgi:hypothetical protein
MDLLTRLSLLWREYVPTTALSLDTWEWHTSQIAVVFDLYVLISYSISHTFSYFGCALSPSPRSEPAPGSVPHVG